MILHKTFDPRDPWARARRMEVVRWGAEHGIELHDGMPKDLMVKRLKAAGIGPPSTPPRYIGSGPRSGDTSPTSHHYKGPTEAPEAETVTVDADDILEREYAQYVAQPKPVLGFNEMRAALKSAGIKINKKWNKAEVTVQYEKLTNGKNAS